MSSKYASQEYSRIPSIDCLFFEVVKYEVLKCEEEYIGWAVSLQVDYIFDTELLVYSKRFYSQLSSLIQSCVTSS